MHNAQHARAKYEPVFTSKAVARLLMAEGRGVQALRNVLENLQYL